MRRRRGAFRLHFANNWRRARSTERREEDGEDRDRQQEVGNRAGKYDEEPLPHGFVVEAPLALLRRQLGQVARRARRMLVADELHISAERQPADLPSRPALVGPSGDLTTEPNREDLGANAEPASDEVMSHLGNEHERPQRADERYEDKPDWRLRKHQAQRSSMSRVTLLRTSWSISNTSSMDCGRGLSFCWRALSTSRAMSENLIPPSRKLATAVSLAAFRTAGAEPRASSASRARRSAGKRSRSGSSKSRRDMAAR